MIYCRQSTIRDGGETVKVVVERFNEQGTLRFQLAGPIGVITIDRSSQRNALTQDMWKTMKNWVVSLPSKTRLLVIRGAGSDFTAGSDIKEFSVLTVDQANIAFETMEETISAIENVSIPTIASINGPAFGAGFILALACDVRIGTENAMFGMPVGKLGVTLQPPFLRRMIQTLGPSRTKDLIYTARSYKANQAMELGILNYLVPSVKLDSETISLARRMLLQSRASLLAVKKNVNLVLSGMQMETGYWVDNNDFKEGVRAFTEKRPAHF
ncbi:enoyl-CoA hydratase/isomerase family protein [Alicyclobacillus sp. TC]|nr:enoyl-CoA hydratase/isomerase family protein [Alicyclobacillus sp. TC]